MGGRDVLPLSYRMLQMFLSLQFLTLSLIVYSRSDPPLYNEALQLSSQLSRLERILGEQPDIAEVARRVDIVQGTVDKLGRQMELLRRAVVSEGNGAGGHAEMPGGGRLQRRGASTATRPADDDDDQEKLTGHTDTEGADPNTEDVGEANPSLHTDAAPLHPHSASQSAFDNHTTSDGEGCYNFSKLDETLAMMSEQLENMYDISMHCEASTGDLIDELIEATVMLDSPSIAMNGAYAARNQLRDEYDGPSTESLKPERPRTDTNANGTSDQPGDDYSDEDAANETGAVSRTGPGAPEPTPFQLVPLGDQPRPKILFICAIYGTGASRPYLPFFLKSAEHSGMDFLLFGDPPIPFRLPPNVKQIHLPWDDLVTRIERMVFGSRKLDEMRRASMYKIIDVKPLYGYLFQEMLQDYDFWAYGDNDMIFGNVTKFLTTEMLLNNDVIVGNIDNDPMHKTWGPFTIMRNSPIVVEMFKLAPGLLHIFNSQWSFFFDEWGGGDKQWYNTSMSMVVNQLIDAKKIRWHGGFPIGWDGQCAKKGRSGFNEACAECKLSVYVTRDDFYDIDYGSQNLMWDQRFLKVASNTASIDAMNPRKEVLLCHFQHGKNTANELLSRMTKAERHVLLKKPVIFQSFGNGFYSKNRAKTRRVFNARVKARREKQNKIMLDRQHIDPPPVPAPRAVIVDGAAEEHLRAEPQAGPTVPADKSVA